METLWQIEANIDDMNPQNMEYVFQKLLDLGVNDVWAMPMMMKKLPHGLYAVRIVPGGTDRECCGPYIC